MDGLFSSFVCAVMVLQIVPRHTQRRCTMGARLCLLCSLPLCTNPFPGHRSLFRLSPQSPLCLYYPQDPSSMKSMQRQSSRCGAGRSGLPSRTGTESERAMDVKKTKRNEKKEVAGQPLHPPMHICTWEPLFSFPALELTALACRRAP